MKIDFTRKQLEDLSLAIDIELNSAKGWEGKDKGEYAKIKRLERTKSKLSAALYQNKQQEKDIRFIAGYDAFVSNHDDE